MPTEITQVRGDHRTDELAAKNVIDIPPVPEELEDWARDNPVYIFNVSGETFRIEHPLVGTVVINPCPDGKEYSEPTIIPGLIPYGVRTEMQSADLRHESGRQFAVDLLGIGAFKNKAYSLARRGVFIAANDTFDADKMVTFKLGKARISLPEWVNLKKGECAVEPTKKELKKAHAAMTEWDHGKIQEADRYWDNGPADKNEGQGNITAEHRFALRRRGQVREWDKPQETLSNCPGCQERIRPGVVVHTCGAVLDWDKAISLGIKKAEDRPQVKKSA